MTRSSATAENRHQIESTRSQLRASSHDGRHVVGVANKLDRRLVLLTTRSTYRGEIFEVQSLRLSSGRKCPRTRISLEHSVG